MRYIQRDTTGKILGHFAHPHSYASECVRDDHPDIVAWDAARERSKGPTIHQRIAHIEAVLGIKHG